jgi:hypothetical protein
VQIGDTQLRLSEGAGAEMEPTRQATAGGFCSHCGAPVNPNSKYCPKCGSLL